MAIAAVSTTWVAPISSRGRTLASAARRFLVFPRSPPIAKPYPFATASPLFPAGFHPFSLSLFLCIQPKGSNKRIGDAFCPGICDVAHALKQGSGAGGDTLLKGVDRTVIEVVKNVTEMARRASSRREIVQTDFLTPPMLKESMLALEKLADIKAVAQGGYPQAERCRISVGHPEAMTGAPDEVAALSISGNFGFEPCSHGDFLGAILGTGIVREKVGDILLQGEKGAQVLVVPELVDFLVSALDKVGKVPVSCTQIPLLALEYEPPRTKSFKAVEASLRVDALASAGFKISRSKLVDLISNGDVRVNWSPVLKNGTTLKTGDIVSVNGKGRLKIGEITTTRKGRYAVELILYL